ncbi:MAG: hypothetical protein IT320_22230 [Anaerolineae bacterium]|nr:hypothetical protein [Anaerolineae bacterium]
MTGILSVILAVGILVVLMLAGAVALFELASRIRDRLFSPETQLKRADLGKYPYWQA